MKPVSEALNEEMMWVGGWGGGLLAHTTRLQLLEKQHTLGTHLPISLKWLQCSHKDMWDLK